MAISARAYYRPQRRAIGGIAVLALLSAQLEAAVLVLVVPLAQAVAEGDERAGGSLGPVRVDLSVDQLFGVALALVGLAAASNALVTWVRSRFVAQYEQRERDEMLTLFMGTAWPTQLAVRDGRLLQLSGYTTRSAMILMNVAMSMRAAASVVTFVGISFLIEPRAALAIVVTGGVLSVALRPLSRKVRALNARLSEQNLEYAQDLSDASANARDLRVFGASEVALARLHAQSADMTVLKERSNLLSGLMAPAFQYAGLVLILVAILIASRARAIDMGELGAIAILLLRSLSYAQQLQNGYRSVIENMPFLDRLVEARSLYQANQVPTGGAPLEAVHTVALEGVSYSYDGEQPALSDIDLTMHAGEVVGVVGPSGSGKSTLLQILLRLREPTAGRLIVNGVPSRDYSLDSWYEQITMVPQQTHLFHATVAENIAMLRPGVSREEIEAAARSAGIHDVIESLADGYDTMVGPSFRDLSGGQVQRIGIARALARGASVLVLDEPTSSLDVHSEAQIQETLTALHGEVLLVVIAHRLSTLSICDRLVVLHEGRLEAAGPLAEVFETNEFFRTALDTGTLDLAPTEPERS